MKKNCRKYMKIIGNTHMLVISLHIFVSFIYTNIVYRHAYYILILLLGLFVFSHRQIYIFWPSGAIFFTYVFL